MKARKQSGVNAAAWFYAQPGFRQPEAEQERRRQHTPGPWAWTVIGEKVNGYIVGLACKLDGTALSGRVEPDDLTDDILTSEVGSHEAATCNYADAQLISAAPDLLAALRAVVAAFREAKADMDAERNAIQDAYKRACWAIARAEGVGPVRGQSDDQTQRATGQQTVMPGVPGETPDEAVTTVTGGERPAQKPTRDQAHSSGSLTPEAQSGGASGQVNADQQGVTAGETALSQHLASCLNCFKLSDGTPVRCSDGMRLTLAAQWAKGLDAGPIQHKFKSHPTGRDFCTRSVLVSRAVYRKGLTLPADRRYCGAPAFLHVSKR